MDYATSELIDKDLFFDPKNHECVGDLYVGDTGQMPFNIAVDLYGSA